LKDDESIWQCRLLLQHPLAIEDDMRLVSTVELMAIRERVNNNLSPFERPADEITFAVIQQADSEFRNWYKTWDQAFSQKYEDAGMTESTSRYSPTCSADSSPKRFTAKVCRSNICMQSSSIVQLRCAVSMAQKMSRRCQPLKGIWRYAQYALLARVLKSQLTHRRIARE
jgi:hypothetical protein